jgi:hypothetical protein
MKPRRSTRGATPILLLALWGAGLILFNFPMLIIFDRDTTLFGLPLLPVALFVIWALLIGALAWLLERGARRPEDRDPPPDQRGPSDPAARP